jgi:hypothetical protein
LKVLSHGGYCRLLVAKLPTRHAHPLAASASAGHRLMRAMILAGCLLAALMLGGCNDIRYGFEAGSRFSVPEVAVVPGSDAAVCFDDLAVVDAGVRLDTDGWEQVSQLGALSEAAFRKQERRRQRDWDEQYCRRQAECHTLAIPQVSVSDVADRVDVCLKNRAQQRVAMEL